MEANDWACFLFMVGQQSVQLKAEMGPSFNFPSVLGLINMYGRARAGSSTETESKALCLRRVISEGQEERRRLIRASDSVNSEQNRAGNIVPGTHGHVRPIGGVSESTAMSAVAHTPQLHTWKKNRWTEIESKYFEYIFPRHLSGGYSRLKLDKMFRVGGF